MKTLKACLSLLAVVVVGTLAGCSTTSTKAADVSDSIRTSLDQAGLKDVSVSPDRDMGVVTLGGQVAADAHKSQAAFPAPRRVVLLPPSACCRSASGITETFLSNSYRLAPG